MYLRKREYSEWHTRLIIAKTKVAPLNQISLLRLELCAASLFTRLVHMRGFTHVRKIYVYVDKLHGGIRMDSRSSFMMEDGQSSDTNSPSGSTMASRAGKTQRIVHHVGCLRSILIYGGRDPHGYNSSRWLDSCLTRNFQSHPQRSKIHAVATYRTKKWTSWRYSSLQKLLRVSAWCHCWRYSRPGIRGETIMNSGTLTTKKVDFALLT